MTGESAEYQAALAAIRDAEWWIAQGEAWIERHKSDLPSLRERPSSAVVVAKHVRMFGERAVADMSDGTTKLLRRPKLAQGPA